MYGERGSIVDLDGIAKKRPYCMVAGDIEAVVEFGIIILRRDRYRDGKGGALLFFIFRYFVHYFCSLL